MIVYTCPKCGGHLQFSTVATYPPIHVTECFSCGWREEKMDEIEKIPYKTTTAASDVAWSNDDEYLSKDELYTKADMVAILTEMLVDVKEIESQEQWCDYAIDNCISRYDVEKLIQQKINSLTEGTDDR